MVKIKEPRPEVELVGKDGNAFFILGAVQRVLKNSKLYTNEEIHSIMDEMTEGNYNHLLQIAMKYCEVY